MSSKSKPSKRQPVADPTADHDDDALVEAARRMHAPDPKRREPDPDPDPPGGHEDEALDEAARRMATDR